MILNLNCSTWLIFLTFSGCSSWYCWMNFLDVLWMFLILGNTKNLIDVDGSKVKFRMKIFYRSELFKGDWDWKIFVQILDNCQWYSDLDVVYYINQTLQDMKSQIQSLFNDFLHRHREFLTKIFLSSLLDIATRILSRWTNNYNIIIYAN